jgi:hypothetical protein
VSGVDSPDTRTDDKYEALASILRPVATRLGLRAGWSFEAFAAAVDRLTAERDALKQAAGAEAQLADEFNTARKAERARAERAEEARRHEREMAARKMARLTAERTMIYRQINEIEDVVLRESARAERAEEALREIAEPFARSPGVSQLSDRGLLERAMNIAARALVSPGEPQEQGKATAGDDIRRPSAGGAE